MTGPFIAACVGIGLTLIVLGYICHRDESGRCLAVRDYALYMLKDGTTWRGLVMVATGVGIVVEPAKIEMIVAGGTIVAGVLGVIWPPRTK